MNECYSLISEPIFLVGAERSGTTLLRLMLDSHHEIAFYSEFEFAVDYFQKEQYPLLKDYYEFLSTNRLFQASSFQIDRRLNYPQLINSFLVQKQEKSAKRLIGATVHRHFDRLLSIWPDAKFIHIVRDSRDVAYSCIKMNWAGNVWTGCDRWLETEKLWSQVKANLTDDRYVEICYETLIAQPAESLTKICEFVGTEYTPKMLDYSKNSSYDLPNPQFSQQWKYRLSKKEIELIEAKTGDLLKTRGYKLNSELLIRINLLTELYLKLHNKLAVVWGRVTIYGLFLILSSFLSRMLNFQEWQKYIQLQCNQIDAARLK